MQWEWVGVIPLLMMILITSFVVYSLHLIMRAMFLSSASYGTAKQREMYKPIILVMGYSLIWLLFRQLVDFGFIVYTDPTIELVTTVVIHGLFVVVGFGALYRVLYLLRDQIDPPPKSKSD